ncbi:PKD domain-containing protein [Microvirga sp. STR05]|uniref:PKD domain-containing protein n=1 Tax=Hymenobacter duratus TaxID=2771356 RepID=A0ABR8JDU2_9BACT|nr:PKD domain-containing protein [Hymenobacter duratus]MBD2713492.1 PKD domain-containing protein [Hymenobacter duratus]MBR7948394.1 PKD domain-containing protein [Microvirga sp. STR05]
MSKNLVPIIGIALSIMACKKESSNVVAPAPTTPAVAPTADFTYSGVLQNMTPIAFTSTSVGADTYNWKFGDGSTSTERNPIHTFRKSGVRTVELQVTGPTGIGTTTKSIPLALADTMSIIATSLTGNYRMTKKVYHQYALLYPYTSSTQTTPCDIVLVVTRNNMNIKIDSNEPDMRLLSSSALFSSANPGNLYFRYFGFRGTSASNRDEAYFKLGTDSLIYYSGYGGSGGGSWSMYYGKKQL